MKQPPGPRKGVGSHESVEFLGAAQVMGPPVWQAFACYAPPVGVPDTYHMFVFIYLYTTPPPWTLVLLPFGDGKSRISKFIFSKFPIVGPQSVIIWSPESSTMSQYDTLCT